MFHRDVMVLALSDGVMCGATGFGLVLQKLVKRGAINWDREGWVIQSVSAPSTYVVDIILISLLVLGSVLPRSRPRMDAIQRVAMDPYGLLCAPWPRYADEAAFICIL